MFYEVAGLFLVLVHFQRHAKLTTPTWVGQGILGSVGSNDPVPLAVTHLAYIIYTTRKAILIFQLRPSDSVIK